MPNRARNSETLQLWIPCGSRPVSFKEGIAKRQKHYRKNSSPESRNESSTFSFSSPQYLWLPAPRLLHHQVLLAGDADRVCFSPTAANCFSSSFPAGTSVMSASPS